MDSWSKSLRESAYKSNNKKPKKKINTSNSSLLTLENVDTKPPVGTGRLTTSLERKKSSSKSPDRNRTRSTDGIDSRENYEKKNLVRLTEADDRLKEKTKKKSASSENILDTPVKPGLEKSYSSDVIARTPLQEKAGLSRSSININRSHKKSDRSPTSELRKSLSVGKFHQKSRPDTNLNKNRSVSERKLNTKEKLNVRNRSFTNSECTNSLTNVTAHGQSEQDRKIKGRIEKLSGTSCLRLQVASMFFCLNQP